jgi:hypothetical protein
MSDMPRDLHEYYYFDPDSMKTYKVIAIPQIKDARMKVYDADTNPRACYFVNPKWLGRTEVEAIKLAREDIERVRAENSRKLNELEKEAFEIHRLLMICDDQH